MLYMLVSQLVAIWVTRSCVPGITVRVFKSPLFYLIMIPKCKSSDADSSDMPQRSHEVLLQAKKNVCLLGEKM